MISIEPILTKNRSDIDILSISSLLLNYGLSPRFCTHWRNSHHLRVQYDRNRGDVVLNADQTEAQEQKRRLSNVDTRITNRISYPIHLAWCAKFCYVRIMSGKRGRKSIWWKFPSYSLEDYPEIIFKLTVRVQLRINLLQK